MSQSSLFWTTDNVGDGPSAGYAQQRLYDLWASVFVTDEVASEGVLFGIESDLNITGTVLPLLVEAGSAVAHGFFYENDSNFNVTGSSVPAIDTTGGRINLVVNWTTQTVRVIANQSADGVSALPALTQNAGVEWHTPLYTYQVTTGGAVTVTDVRTFCHFATQVTTEMIEDDAITAAKIAANAVGSSEIAANAVDTSEIATGAVDSDELAADAVIAGKIADGAVDVAATLANNVVETAKIKNLNVTSGKLATDAVIAGKIANGAVDATATLANDIVDDAKVGNRVPALAKRQGGNASDWSTYGNTAYTPTAVRIEVGVKGLTVGSGDTSQTVALTFPTAFDEPPVVSATIEYDVVGVVIVTKDITASGCTLKISTGDGGNFGAVITFPIHWIAIGAE